MSTILKNFDDSKMLYKHYLTLPIVANIRFFNTTLSVESKDKSDCGKGNDDLTTDSDSSDSKDSSSSSSSGSSTSDEEEESLAAKESEFSKGRFGGEGLSSTRLRLPDLTSLAGKSWDRISILKHLRSPVKSKSPDTSPEKPEDKSFDPCEEESDSKFISKDSKGWRMAGDYPVEYNASVHGPYDPSRFYGKPDTPLGQVKISELGSWFGRRNKTPTAVVASISRAYWRWQQKYMLPKRATVAPILQFMSCAMLASYFLNFYKIKHHYYYKYH